MKKTAGDLQVWWIPQVKIMTGEGWECVRVKPMKAFEVDVSSVAEGVKLMDVLADYDRFQFENQVKPDYCNVGGLRRWCADTGDGVPGWEDWYDEETGEDDPAAWLEAVRVSKGLCKSCGGSGQKLKGAIIESLLSNASGEGCEV